MSQKILEKLWMIRHDLTDETLPKNKCPVDPDDWVVYRTFIHVRRYKYRVKVSHLHAPVKAKWLNWTGEGQGIGQIYDYAVVSAPPWYIANPFEVFNGEVKAA